MTSVRSGPNRSAGRRASSSGESVWLTHEASYLIASSLSKSVAIRLRTTCHGLETDGGYRIRPVHEFFARPLRRGHADVDYMIPAGLEPALRHLLAESGRGCEDVGRPTMLPRSLVDALAELTGMDPAVVNARPEWTARFLELALPDRSRPPLLGPPELADLVRRGPTNTDLLDLAGRRNRALVRCGPGVDRTHVAAEFPAAFPGERWAIVATRRRERDAVARRLDDLGVEHFVYRDGWHGPRTADGRIPAVSVGTPRQLSQDGWHHWAAAVFVDAVEALGAVYEIERLARRVPRMFGLVPAERRHAPGDRDRLRAWFGFDEAVVLRGGHVPPVIEVTWERVVGGPRLDDDLDPAALAERGIDRHPVRNRRVMRAAVKAAERGSVALLAGSVPHVGLLARGLGDWAVALGPSVDLSGLPRSLRTSLLTAGRRRHDGRLILSPEAARRTDLAAFDVVIRASGGDGLVAGLRDSAGVPAGTRRVVRLVDFDDRHHPRLTRLAERRRKAYRAAGWLPPGVDPVAARVEDFLRGRG